jgi:hypothetical protein
MPAMNESRFKLAMVVAPIAPVILIVFAHLFLPYGFGNAFPLAVIFSLATSYLGFFLFGLPMLSLLRRSGYLNFGTLLAAGAVAGMVAFAAFLFVFGLLLGTPGSYGLLELGWGVALGLVVAILFGFVAGITRGSTSPPSVAGRCAINTRSSS